MFILGNCTTVYISTTDCMSITDSTVITHSTCTVITCIPSFQFFKTFSGIFRPLADLVLLEETVTILDDSLSSPTNTQTYKHIQTYYKQQTVQYNYTVLCTYNNEVKCVAYFYTCKSLLIFTVYLEQHRALKECSW